MASNSLLDALGVWTLTYLAHSTLLLTAAALIGRRLARGSYALRERVWKLAALGGLITATLALLGGWGLPIGREPLHEVAAVDSIEPQAASMTEQTRSVTQPSVAVTAEDAELLREADALAALTEDASRIVTIDDSQQADRILPALNGRLDRTSERLASQTSNSIINTDRSPAANSTVATIVEHHNNMRLDEAQQVTLAQRMNEPKTALGEFQVWVLSGTRCLGWVTVLWVMSGLLLVTQRACSLSRALRRCSIGNAEQLSVRLLDQLVARTGQRRVPRLLFSADITEPLAGGVWKPTIILPVNIEQRLNSEELRALLAHELAHLQRGDVIWLWVGAVLCSSLSFQPLNFIARRSWQAAAEVQCDDWAVAHDVSAVSLANCLVRVAEWTLDRRTTSALAATGASGSLSQRIERLLSDPVIDAWSTRWRSRLSLLIAFAFGLLFASVAPRFDESLWAHNQPEDIEERLKLWNEIQAELEAARREIEELPMAVPSRGGR